MPSAASGTAANTIAISVALVAAILIVYARVWQHQFVNYDDPEYVTRNPKVLGGLTLNGIAWAFTTGWAANWHPLTWLSHMVDVQLFGLNAGAHHSVSVLLHAANSLLLFGLLNRVTGAPGRSAFVAALFAVHPLHVESVAWVAERKDVLSTLFWMLTLWGYVRYAARPSARTYLVVVALFTLGLMAKPMLVTLPFVLLLLDIWPLRRVSFNGIGTSSRRSSSIRSAWPLVVEKLPLVLLSGASSVVTFFVQRSSGAVQDLDHFPFGLRVQNAALSYVSYIGNMLWPARLNLTYPYSLAPSGSSVAAAVLLLVFLSLIAIASARRHPYVFVGWFWYVGTLVPVIGLVQVGRLPMADRYTYIPLIGLFIAVTWAIARSLEAYAARKIILPLIAGLVLIASTARAREQVTVWENSRTLWKRALELVPANYGAHLYLGTNAEEQGNTEEALAEYSEALRINPGFLEAVQRRAHLLANQGRMVEASTDYVRVLELDPADPVAHHDLAVILASQGRRQEAVEHYSAAIRSLPTYAQAHNDLGITLSDQGNLEKAVTHYQEAIRLQPDYADPHTNLAAALMALNKRGDAIRELREALRIRPNYPLARSNLGLILAREGNFSEALPEFLEAARLRPDWADYEYNAALMFEKTGNPAEAKRHLERALRISPDHQAARQLLEGLAPRPR